MLCPHIALPVCVIEHGSSVTLHNIIIDTDWFDVIWCGNIGTGQLLSEDKAPVICVN